MKVFVVTSGEYSDYCICAIFSSRRLAKAWVDLHDGDDYGPNFDIAEWVLDGEAGAERVTVHGCGIFLDSGKIIEGPWQEVRVCKPFRGNVTQRAIKPPCYSGMAMSRVESGVSKEHCLKLAAEERQAWLRETSGKGGAA